MEKTIPVHNIVTPKPIPAVKPLPDGHKPIHIKQRLLPRPSNFPPAFEREVLDPILVRNPYVDFNRRYCDLN